MSEYVCENCEGARMVGKPYCSPRCREREQGCEEILETNFQYIRTGRFVDPRTNTVIRDTNVQEPPGKKPKS